MRKRIISLSLAVILSLICIFAFATPAFAIDNPDEIWFGTQSPLKYSKCFENVNETGDMLFLAESWVKYDPTSPPGVATDYFIFEVRNAAGTTVLASRKLQSYGDRPMSIYLTAAQVTTLGLVPGTAYVTRITGNPLWFAPIAEDADMVNYPLSPRDWIDQSVATATDNPLREACIYIAENMEEEDAVSTYLIESGAVKYLTPTGGALFSTGIPSLSIFVPSLFQISAEALTAEAPDSTGTYQSFTNIESRLGTTISTGLTNLGTWLGVSQIMMAGIVLMALLVLLAVYIYHKTNSGKAVMVVIVAATYPTAAFLGLSSLVITFIIVVMVVLLLGYYFLTRGSL